MTGEATSEAEIISDTGFEKGEEVKCSMLPFEEQTLPSMFADTSVLQKYHQSRLRSYK